MRKDWNGIMKILEIQHVRNNEVIWENKNLYNMLHTDGERFFLEVLFRNPNDGTLPPPFYYLGLDARGTLDVNDAMINLLDEPTNNAYARQLISSAPDQTTGWTVTTGQSGDITYHKALGSIITFNAAGGSWGPITKLFLTNKVDNTGYLISSVELTSEVYMEDGDALNLRMGISLRDYSI